MTTKRPYVFIGSSKEGKDIAEAIQANLDYDCECHIWHQGLFGTGGGTLETLVNKLRDFDFAILVCTPDDVVLSRGESRQTPRDNVLLELGMFIGALGRERVFIVVNRDAATKMPSDLAGVEPATFTPPQAGNYRSALGAACSGIKSAIQSLGAIRSNQRNLRVTATICATDAGMGPCVEVLNNDAKTLPPHRVFLYREGDKRISVTLIPSKKGELLPNQRRKYSIYLFTLDEQPITFTANIFKQPTPDWTLRLVLEDSDAVLHEDIALGRAIGRVLTRAVELGGFTNVEPALLREMCATNLAQ